MAVGLIERSLQLTQESLLMDITFGNLGTLSDDILGKNNQKSGTTIESNSVSKTLELSDAWSDFESNGLSLVRNSGAMADRPPETSKKMIENMGSILSDSRKIMMKGGSLQELKQYLRFAVKNDKNLNDPRVKDLLSEYGLLGNVYLDRRVFASCNELKDFWREHRNPTAEFLLGAELCRTCEKTIDFCPKIGLKVAESIDYTSELLEKFKSKLALCGKCRLGEVIENKEQLRRAFIAELAPESRPTVLPKAVPAAAISQEEITASLEAEKRRKADEARDQQRLLEVERDLRPILRSLQELMLTGADLNTLRESFERKGFSRDIIGKNVGTISWLLKDGLIRCGQKIIPGLYEKCEDCREFLAAHRNIRPRFAVKQKRCSGCIHNNGIGCRLFVSSFLEPGGTAPLEARRIAIDNLKEKTLISHAEANRSELIEQFQPGEGIKEALQLIDKRSSLSPVRTVDVSGQVPMTQNQRSTGNELTIWKCLNALGTGMKLSTIEKHLEGALDHASVETALNEALCSLKAIKTDQLDFCMIKKYPLNSDCKLVRAEKCSTCNQGSDKMHCKVQGLAFCHNIIDQLSALPDNENAEGREIQSYFEGSEMTIAIDPMIKKQSLDFELLNPGEDLLIDSGSRSVDPTPAIISSMGSAEMVVEIDPPRKMERPLKIGSLGPNFDVEV
jgi:hypothetical protein